MNKLTVYFIAGAVLSPLVLVFGKLLVFIVGLITLIWVWRTWMDITQMEEDDDPNDHRGANGT